MRTFDDVFWFGKYKGKTIEEVFEKDALYLAWCLDNIDSFRMSEEDEERIDDKADEEDMENDLYIGCDPEWWRD